MVVLTVLGALLAGVLLLPFVSDMVSLIRVMVRAAPTATPAPITSSRLLFLIPAHDEEALIEDCVRSVLAMQYPRERVGVVVVADNCSDQTAARARACGVECWERSDPVLRGKPRALAWALERADLRAYDGVIILDADSVVDPGFATGLNRVSPLRSKAVQCYNDVGNRGASALTRMATVFSAARFRGALPLKRALGLTIPLGNGLCVGTEVLRDHPWRAFGLSEDLEVYAMFTAMGVPIDFAVNARLYSQETQTMRQSASQRQRWLTGRIAALAEQGPALVRSKRIGWHQKLDAIGELASPGPAVHLAASASFAALLWLTGAPAASWVCAALAVSLLRPAAYVIIGVWHDPEPARAAAAFAFLPLYSVWRFAVAVRGLALLRGGEWVRTARS